MRIAVFSLFLAGAFALTPSPFAPRAGAQGGQQPRPPQTPGAPLDTDQRERVTTREVRLLISVLDKKDKPVAGLTRGDFLVFEDKQPQQISGFFTEGVASPLYIGVLMDTSSSAAGKLKFEQEAAKDFIYTVVRLRKDKVAFATFDDDIKLIQDFTDKLDLLDRAVDSVKKPGTQTALWDAVWQFCDEKMRGAPGRRVIVVITDGDDTYSRARLKDAIEIAQATETTVFAISTKAGLSGTVPGVEQGTPKDGGDRELDRLCAETGGKAFFIGDRLALERSFTKVANELHGQYVVTYRPTNTNYDGRERRIEVKLTGNRDGLRVRARRGYTATPDLK